MGTAFPEESPEFPCHVQNDEASRQEVSDRKKTLRKWVWVFVDEIVDLEDKVIVWENRIVDGVSRTENISVDTVDCGFQQILIPHPEVKGKMIINKDLYSFKLNGPTLRHEVAASLRSNDAVHITGPHFPGHDNDLSIFRKELKGKLDDGERAAADAMNVAKSLEKHFALNVACLLWRKKHC